MTPPSMGTEVRQTILKGLTFAVLATAMMTPATGDILRKSPAASWLGSIIALFRPGRSQFWHGIGQGTPQEVGDYDSQARGRNPGSSTRRRRHGIGSHPHRQPYLRPEQDYGSGTLCHLQQHWSYSMRVEVCYCSYSRYWFGLPYITVAYRNTWLHDV